jgi:hypothetical protein
MHFKIISTTSLFFLAVIIHNYCFCSLGSDDDNILIDTNEGDEVLLKFVKNAQPHHLSSFTVLDKDYVVINIRRLDEDDLLESCYEASKTRKDNGTVEAIRFCFPSINVAGHQKCGTSSMYEFLAKGGHPHLAVTDAKAKELCPNSIVVSLFFDFFKRLVPLYKERHSKKYHVNGCIHEVQNLVLHYILEPKTVYIMMVRNLVEQMWGAYNYWCKGSFENICKGGYKSREGMYRDPVMFDQLLIAANYELHISYDFIKSCSKIGTFYRDILSPYTDNHMKLSYIVMAMENFEDPDELHRLQHFINRHLQSKIRFSSSKVPHINYNDHSLDPYKLNVTKLLEKKNVYAISHYKPLLQKTRDYVQSCWHEDCLKMSDLSNYRYNCTLVDGSGWKQK